MHNPLDFWLPTVVLALMVGQSGCATWDSPEPVREWKLPTPQPAVDTIVLETAFVRLPAATALWTQIDEQTLPLELRRRLAANGFRAGVLNDPLPDEIRQALDATRDPLAVLSAVEATTGDELLVRRERRQCPSGTTEELEVLSRQEHDQVVLFNDEGRVRAERFAWPRGLLRLQIQGSAEEWVRLSLLPVIEHGEERQRVIGSHVLARLDTRRDRASYEDLTISAAVARGQTLVVSATAEPRGLGGAWFAGRFGPGDERLLLLVRIADSQSSDLFGATPRHEPLAASGDP